MKKSKAHNFILHFHHFTGKQKSKNILEMENKSIPKISFNISPFDRKQKVSNILEMDKN